VKKRTCKLCKRRLVDDPRPSVERALLETDIRRQLQNAPPAESYENADMRARAEYATRLGRISYELRAIQHALNGICWFCASEQPSSTSPTAEKRC